MSIKRATPPRTSQPSRRMLTAWSCVRSHVRSLVPGAYRALTPYAHVMSYERSAPAVVLVHDKAGNAGAFTQLITRHPSLAQQLRSELTSGRVKLVAGGDNGRLKFLNGAIQRFQQACRALGLGAGDYPFNQKDRAVR